MNFLAGDDVLLRLQREHAQHFDEVGVVDVNLNGAGVADVDLRRRHALALFGRLRGRVQFVGRANGSLLSGLAATGSAAAVLSRSWAE